MAKLPKITKKTVPVAVSETASFSQPDAPQDGAPVLPETPALTETVIPPSMVAPVEAVTVAETGTQEAAPASHPGGQQDGAPLSPETSALTETAIPPSAVGPVETGFDLGQTDFQHISVFERVLVITAPAGPRRRAGFAFGPEPVELMEADLGDTAEEQEKTFKALMDDPRLKIDGRMREIKDATGED